jgi:hypothetical protein
MELCKNITASSRGQRPRLIEMQCNFLRKLVKTGREADKNCEDEPKRKLLMESCQTIVGIKGL